MESCLIIDTINHIDKKVYLNGWIDKRRDHGKIVFLDLRDRSGVVQLVCSREVAINISPEDVISVSGIVKKRPENLINHKVATGTVEVTVEKIIILNKSNPLPF